MRPRLSPRQKAGAAVALALLLWMPSGISTESFPVVTGHSVFYNGDTFDKCLASIAGIMRSRVMWFNDMVLVEQYAGKGTFIYITQAGSEDPTPAARSLLWTEGVFYDFVDPNGAHWHVEEAFMLENMADPGYQPHVDDVGKLGRDDYRVGIDRDHSKRTYVWIVELSERPIHDQFAGDDPRYAHDLYNFLLIVDTCKMKRDATQPGHQQDPDRWNVTHEGENLTTERGHPAGTDVHEHEMHQVNLWVSTRPLLVPIGADPTGASWESEWATGYANNTASGAPEGPQQQPCKPDDPITTEDESGC